MNDSANGQRHIRPEVARAALLVFAGLIWSITAPGAEAEIGRGAFFTRTYRNLFVEAGHEPQEVTHRIEATFEQLFHGDPQSQAVYFPAGSNANGPVAFILDINNRDVRSEGMSYGMMIAVQLDRRSEFDALWNWAKTHMYHSASNYTCWACCIAAGNSGSGFRNSRNGAT